MRVITLLILLFAITPVMAQDPVIQLDATIKDDATGKKMGGVTIEVLADGKPFATKTSASNGKIPLIDLPVGPVYLVKIKKDGYVTKMMQIDSHNDFPEDLPPFYEQPFETGLFKQAEGVDFSFLEREPMIEFSFDSRGLLVWDKPKLKIMQKKIEDLKRELEKKREEAEKEKERLAELEENFQEYVKAGDKAMDKDEYEKAMGQYKAALDLKDDADVQKKYDDAKKKFEDAKANAELQKKFSEKMEAAKKEFDGKNYEQALSLYKEASKIKPDEKLPKDRIAEIENIIAEREKNQAAFNKLVAEGDKAMGSELYDDAISKYEQALELMGDEAVEKKLEEAKKKKEEKEGNEAAMKEKQEEYDKIIAEADQLFDTKKYADAKSKYEEALGIFEGKEHPTKRIAEIAEILKKMEEDAAAKEKLEEDYKALVAEADNMFESQDWENAKTKYKEALELKPDEEYPKDQLDKINKAIAEAEAEAEKNAKYDAAMDEAQGFFAQKKYKEAKEKYNEALNYKPDEQEPKDKIAEIEELMADAEKAAELEQQYKDLMKEGDELKDGENYTAALAKFKEALKIKPDDPDATVKIEEVENLIKEKQEAEAREKEFNDLVAKGDESFNAKDYHAAKQSYLKALDIKDDADVKAKIADCDEMIKKTEDAAALEAKYNELVKEADQLFDQQNYQDAIDKYNEALAQMDKDYPKGRIAECKRKLEEIAKAKDKEEQFNSLVAAGDKAFEEKDYQKALDNYKEALNVKPDPEISKKIGKIETLIAENEQDAALENKYKSKIDEADAAFENKQWEESRALYTEAINIIDRQYPKDQIKEIERQMKLETEQQREEMYQKIITKADGLRDGEEYDDAISYYERAQKFKPDDPYPQEQIDAIHQMRENKADAEAEAKRIQEQYDAYIKKADEAYNAENWSVALENYKNAIKTKDDEQYPKDRAKEIEDKMGNLEALKAKQEQYDDYIAKGDASFNAKDWKTSVKHYQEALEVFPDKQYPKDQIQKANDQMKAESKNEVEEQYQKILAVAQKKMDEKSYKRALDLFLRAKNLKPDDPLPQRKIDEINQILADLAHAEKNQEAYDKLIAEADNLFRNSKWKDARSKYQEAYDLINEKYPKDQIKACTAHMKDDTDAHLLAQYNKILAKADEYFDDQQYDKAKKLYNRAHNLKPSDQYPIDQLKEIERLMNPYRGVAENGMPFRGEPNRNTDAIEVDQLLLEAEMQRRWISNKRASQQEEEHREFIGQHQIHQENLNHETKEEIEEMEYDISQNVWSAEVKRSEAILNTEKSFDDLQEVKRDWAKTNDDNVQHQKQVVEQMELDVEAAKSDGQVARIEFLGDVEKIHMEVIDAESAAMKKQVDKNHATKDNVNELQRTHVSNDPNNDVARKNNEVYIEDYQVALINENNSNVWDQEDEIMGAKDHTEMMIDEIEASNINSDIARIEVTESMKDLKTEHANEASRRSNNQYDANIDQKKFTEGMIDEIEIANLNNDIPRQKMELQVDRTDEEMDDRLGELNDIQTNLVMNTDSEIESIEITIEEANTEREKKREGFEEKVEEMAESIIDANAEFNNAANEESNKAVDHFEDFETEQQEIEREANLKNDEATDEANEFVEDMIKENKKIGDKSKIQRENAGDFIETLKDIDPNKVDERMQNQLGLEFPEGVTEEIYTKDDENGLMVSYVVRRVVVRDGVGDFYEKVKTRSGVVSYTMNGNPITEYQWQDMTEAADLVRN